MRSWKFKREISLEMNQDLIDTSQKVLVDSYDRENDVFRGRTFRDAPEIDNEVVIDFDPKIHIGEFVTIDVYDASEYEIYGKLTTK